MKGKKSNPLIDKFFLEQERNHISELMEKHLIKQKDKEEFKRGDLTVAQYKVAAKIADSLHNKILEKIEDVNLKFEKMAELPELVQRRLSSCTGKHELFSDSIIVSQFSF